MILHFSHIGLTEALTFIAPDPVSPTGLPHVPGVGHASTTIRPLGPTEKDSRGRASGTSGWERHGCPSQSARQEPRLSVLGGTSMPLLSTRSEGRRKLRRGGPASAPALRSGVNRAPCRT